MVLAVPHVRRRPEGRLLAPFLAPFLARRDIVVLALVASAAIHLVVVPSHFRAWAPAGAFFVALAATQLAVAWQVLVGTSRRWLLAGIAINLLALGVWAWSRTTGLPFGPDAGVPEPASILDLVATGCELFAVVVSLSSRRVAAGRAMFAAGFVVLTGFGLVRAHVEIDPSHLTHPHDHNAPNTDRHPSH